MKKFTKMALALLILVIVAFAGVACNAKADEIYVDEANLPLKTTFIRGQGIDFFGGKLTIVNGGVTTDIPMDSDDIKITYDETAIGEVPVTLEYGKKQCIFNVTVVPRLALPSNVNLNYFVGEEFDRPSGSKVTITNDDMSIDEIDINDPEFKIENYNPNPTMTANKATQEIVTLRYKDYTDVAVVNVYKLAGKDKNAPTIPVYESHKSEEPLDLKGGVILYESDVYTSGVPNGYVRRIPITEDMVFTTDPVTGELREGIDFTAVSFDKVDVNQKVTIKFDGYDWETSDRGYEFSYQVGVHFSNVDQIKRFAGQLDDLTYTLDADGINIAGPTRVTQGTGAGNELSDGELKNADDALKLYAGLSAEDKGYVSTEELSDVARPFFMENYTKYLDEAEKFSHTFSFNLSDNSVNFVFDDYEAVKADIAKLYATGNDEEEIFELNRNLLRLKAIPELAFVNALSDNSANTLGNILATITDLRDLFRTYDGAIRNAINIYEHFNDIGIEDNSSADDEFSLTDEQKTKMDEFINYLLSDSVKRYSGAVFSLKGDDINCRPFYEAINNWRLTSEQKTEDPDARGDLFEIVYRYCYEQVEAINNNTSNLSAAEKNKQISDWNSKISEIANTYLLPGELEEVYSDIEVMYSEYVNIASYDQNGYFYDGTAFITHFLSADEKTEKINQRLKLINSDDDVEAQDLSEDDTELTEREKAMKYVYENALMDDIVTQNGTDSSVPISSIAFFFKEAAYYKHFDGYLDIPAIDEMWRNYKNVILSLENREYQTANEAGETKFTDKFRTDISGLFKDFVELSPMARRGFVNSFSYFDNVGLFTTTGSSYYFTLGNLLSYYYLYDIETEAMDAASKGENFHGSTTTAANNNEQTDANGDNIYQISIDAAQCIQNFLNALDCITISDYEGYLIYMNTAHNLYNNLDKYDEEVFDKITGVKEMYTDLNDIYSYFENDFVDEGTEPTPTNPSDDDEYTYGLWLPEWFDREANQTYSGDNTQSIFDAAEDIDSDAEGYLHSDEKTNYDNYKRWINEFLDLNTEMHTLNVKVEQDLNNDDVLDTPMYGAFMAAYLRLADYNEAFATVVNAIEDAYRNSLIQTTADGDGDDDPTPLHSEIYYAYYYSVYELYRIQGTNQSAMASCEAAIYNYRYNEVILLYPITIVIEDISNAKNTIHERNLFDLIESTHHEFDENKAGEFIRKTADFVLEAVKDEPNYTNFNGGNGNDGVKGYVKELAEMDNDSLHTFLALHKDYDMFAYALALYFDDELGLTGLKDAGTETIINKLFDLALAYCDFRAQVKICEDLPKDEDKPSSYNIASEEYDRVLAIYKDAYEDLDSAVKIKYDEIFGDLDKKVTEKEPKSDNQQQQS